MKAGLLHWIPEDIGKLFLIFFLPFSHSLLIADTLVEPFFYPGIQVPGTREGNTFTGGYPHSPIMDESGRGYFGAFSDDEGEAFWMESVPGGDLTPLLNEGDPAPGIGDGSTISGFHFFDARPGISKNGDLVFIVILEGIAVDSSNDRALYWRSASTGEFRLLVREGDSAPGTAVNFGDFDQETSVEITDGGRYLFNGRVTGTGVTSVNDEGYWTGLVDGFPQLLVREGDAAPGTSGGETIEEFEGAHLNSSGNVAIYASLAGAGVDASNDTAIFVGTSAFGDQLPVVREGDPAPGVEVDALFGPNLTLEYFGDDGGIGFSSRLSGSNVVDPASDGLWSKMPGEDPQLIAREGDEAPGTAAGVTFWVLSVREFVDSETVVFATFVEGPGVVDSNNYGIWRGKAGDLTLAGREGSQFPIGFSVGGSLSMLTNSKGDCVFTEGPGFSQEALWLLKSDLTLTELLREGDTVTFAGVTRTLKYVNFQITSDNSIKAFAPAGRMGVRLVFEDNSDGVFAVTEGASPVCVNAVLKASLTNKIKKLKRKIKKAKRSRKSAKAKKLKKKMKKLRKTLAALPC